jgi:ERCC4-type nuclease
MRETSLREIPGIGPTRARTLLTRFGSLSGLAAADPREVEAAVGPATARAVREYLDAGRPEEEAVGFAVPGGEGGRAGSA